MIKNCLQGLKVRLGGSFELALDAYKSPDVYAVGLAIIGICHLLQLGLLTHEFALAGEFSLIFALCRALRLFVLPVPARLLSLLLRVCMNLLSATAVRADQTSRSIDDLEVGARHHWLSIIVIAAISFAGERLAEMHRRARTREIIRILSQPIHNTEEICTPFSIEIPVQAQINVRVACGDFTPLFEVQLRDSCNEYIIRTLRCSNGFATCELPLDAGRYVLFVKKLSTLQPTFRITAHGVLYPRFPVDPVPYPGKRLPVPGSHPPAGGSMSAHILSKVLMPPGSGSDGGPASCPSSAVVPANQNPQDNDEVRRRFEREGMYD